MLPQYTVNKIWCIKCERLFHYNIQKYDGQQNIFDNIQGVWIADETLSQVFDISSQLK